MGSPSAIISLGLGSWGSPSEILTLGYGSGEAPVVEFPYRLMTGGVFELMDRTDGVFATE